MSKVSFVVFYAPRHLLEAVRRLLLVEQEVNNQEGLSGYRTPNAVRLCQENSRRNAAVRSIGGV